MFDAHCHLQDVRFGVGTGAVWQRFADSGGIGMLCCGTKPSDWEAVSRLAAEYGGLVPAFGIHPRYASAAGEAEALLRRYLADNPRACVGEIGLDGAVDSADKALQADVFARQMQLAAEFKRPVSVHCVRAWGRLIEALDCVGAMPPGIVIHSYSGSVEIMRQLLVYGVSFSFSASITNPGFKRSAALVRAVPQDRLLIESDAPDMLPYGLKGTMKFNEPSNLIYVAERVAVLRGISVKDVINMTSDNAQRIFVL